MRIFIIFLCCSVFSSCYTGDRGNVVCYHFTENTPYVDTIIHLKNPKQYYEVSMEIREYWNDTIILNGIKKPPQSRRYMYQAENTLWHDTVHITFDKYKATKVNLYNRFELY